MIRVRPPFRNPTLNDLSLRAVERGLKAVREAGNKLKRRPPTSASERHDEIAATSLDRSDLIDLQRDLRTDALVFDSPGDYISGIEDTIREISELLIPRSNPNCDPGGVSSLQGRASSPVPGA